MILAQRKIFNIFPGSIQASSIVKILVDTSTSDFSLFVVDTSTEQRPLDQQTVL